MGEILQVVVARAYEERESLCHLWVIQIELMFGCVQGGASIILRSLFDAPTGFPCLMKRKPGSYILIYRCFSAVSVHVGRLGFLDFPPGYFLYVGSSFGPRGVAARVSRLCRCHIPFD